MSKDWNTMLERFDRDFTRVGKVLKDENLHAMVMASIEVAYMQGLKDGACELLKMSAQEVH